MNSLLRNCCLLSSLAVIFGCHSAEETLPTPAAASPSVAPASAVPAAPAASSAPRASTKASNSTARQPELADPKVTSAKLVDFKPPFPERADLFEAPKRAQSTIRRDDEHGQTVELKGFVDVGEPSAVLSIDGVLSSVPEGSEKYGVQVISIQPPKAVLQRGRSRWTATLE